MKGSLNARAAWVRAAWFAPLPVGILSLFLGLYPHLFFTSGGELYDSVSFFAFLENTRATCFSILSGAANASPGSVYFSYVMAALWGLTCLLAAWYTVFLLFTSLLASVSLTPRAASPLLNGCKRVYRILVPARGFFVFLSCVPLLLSFLPLLFTLFYKSILGQTAALHYDLLPDMALLAPLTAIGIALYFLTLRDQRDLKLDLFRVYRVER